MALDYFRFKMPGQAGDSQLTDQFKTNAQAFLDWSFLGIGGFFNVTLNTTYPYGGNPSTLRLSDDTRYAAGTAWDAFKTNWVWENNIDYNYQPINISGVYINNTFYPTGTTGPYAYNINYSLGRVVFNSPIATNSTVQVEYSYKYYNIYNDNTQWFRQLTDRSYRIDDSQFNMSGSGIWSIFPDNRAQLPAIVVEVPPRREMTPWGVGGGQWVVLNPVFHVFAETQFDRDNALDILAYQTEKRFFLFDKNIVTRSGVWPISPYGYLQNSSYTYPYLVNNYLWRDCIIKQSNIQRVVNNPQSVYYGVATWKIEVNFPEL